ncbi:tetratricopeptide repeat protein [Chloroflexota bacterium]
MKKLATVLLLILITIIFLAIASGCQEQKDAEPSAPPSPSQPVVTEEPAATEAEKVTQYIQNGISLLKQDKYEQAIIELDKAIELDLSRPPAYFYRGIAYGKKGEHDNAIEDFTSAITLNPTGVPARYNRGFNYQQLGEYDKAIADYSQAINLDPAFAPAYERRGIVYQKQGNTEKAIPDLEKCIEISQDPLMVERVEEILDELQIPEPADFKIDFVNINPNPVSAGEEVQVEVGLGNYGEAKGTYILSLTVNDEVMGSEEIELTGGEETTSIFPLRLDEPGSYDISVDNVTESLRIMELVRPETGIYVVGKKGSSSYGHLEVDNGLDFDSLVVLTKTSSPETPVVAVYVRAEDSCKIRLGKGRLLVYFAYGSNWDNYAKEFTADRSYKKFEEEFDFRNYNYEITLHAVVGGAAYTEQLDEDEFPSME